MNTVTIKTHKDVIQLCIELLVLLISIYYITVVIHFLGFNIFKGKKIEFGKAFIPFYAWITRNINEGNLENFEEETPEEPKVSEEPKTKK